jgi:hypothetical protein
MQGPLWLERGVSNKLVGPTALASQCTKTFELFHCITIDEGTVYLAASPALECYDARWWAFAPLGVAGLAVYVMGIPAAVAVFLHANQKQLGIPSCSSNGCSHCDSFDSCRHRRPLRNFESPLLHNHPCTPRLPFRCALSLRAILTPSHAPGYAAPCSTARAQRCLRAITPSSVSPVAQRTSGCGVQERHGCDDRDASDHGRAATGRAAVRRWRARGCGGGATVSYSSSSAGAADNRYRHDQCHHQFHHHRTHSNLGG